MNIWDKLLPHRRLINRSLRKNADELRYHIDAYKTRYDEQYQRNQEEIEKTRVDLDQQYEAAKSEVLELLSASVEELQVLGDSTTVYISAFFERQLIYHRKELNMLQQSAAQEYIDFLSEQMNLIGIEIDQLRERRDLLSQKAKIDDIIQLIKLTGNVLQADNCENAQELLMLISVKIRETSDDNNIEKYALLNVRTMLEERVSYLDEIQYIIWVIEQKIQLSKELKGTRDAQNLILDELCNQATQLDAAFDRLSATMKEKAQEIRFYWAKAIIYASVDISDLKAEKSTKIDEKRDVQNQINNMVSSHSSDNWQWDHLQRERKDLGDDIQNLSTEISEKIQKRKRLINRRKSLLDLLWNHSAALLRIGNKDQHDEEIYADMRLAELEEIEEAGKVAAEAAYQNEVSRLQSSKRTELEKAEHNISNLQEQLRVQEEKYQVAEAALQKAKFCATEKAKTQAEELEGAVRKANKTAVAVSQKLANLRAADNRFFLVRIFSETPEIQRAKQEMEQANGRVTLLENNLLEIRNYIKANLFPEDSEVQKAQKEVMSAKKDFDQAQTAYQTAQAEYKKTEQDFDTQISQTQPRPERPTSSERLEMSKLRNWKKQQSEISYIKGGVSDERKNRFFII